MAAGPSGRGCNLVVAFGRLRGSSAPARTRCRLIFRLDRKRCGAIGADRRRKHVQRQAVLVRSVHQRAAVFILVGLVGAALLTEGATIPVTVTVAVTVATTVAAVEALAAIAPALTVLVAAVGFGRFHLLLALVLIGIVALTGALVLEAGAVLAENSEIMVSVLEVIFGLDPVAGELGIARQALVFFEQLSGVAALTVVLAVPRLSTEVLPPLPSAAATAATLSLIDKMPTSLRSNLVTPWP